MYLAINQLPEIIERYYAGRIDKHTRLVGRPPQHPSAYFDIVRFFGPAALNPGDVRIEYASEMFHLQDPLVKSFAADMQARMAAEGRLRSGTNATRLARVNFDGANPAAVLQESDYGEQAGSSFALDFPDHRFDRWGGTLRHYWKAEYPTLALEASPLGITLGVSAMLIAEERGQQFMLIVRRGRRLASLEKSVGPSIAGGVDFRRDFTTLADVLLTTLVEEMFEETGLTASEAHLVPLAYGREILRGDRPQLFGLVLTSFPRYQLKRLLKRQQHGEFDSFFFALMTERRINDRFLASMNFEARMNYHLAEEYLGLLGNAGH